MAIYELTKEALTKVPETAFEVEGVLEKGDIQRLLRDRIDVLRSDFYVLAEEYGDWIDAKRRIDLLGLDRYANLVVIELKRTADGGHMELQAIRYAAMVSTMTFDQAVEAHERYLTNSSRGNEDARQAILDFLDWKEPKEDLFGQTVRIVLISRDFSTEITSTVLWLNDSGLDIQCVRLKPYKLDDRVLVDVQQLIPLPEAAAFHVQMKSKAIRERSARRNSRDITRYDLQIGNRRYQELPKRRLIFRVIQHACESGIQPEEIRDVIKWKSNLWYSINGERNGTEFVNAIAEHRKSKGSSDDRIRFFCKDEELIYTNATTYALTNQWGVDTLNAVDQLRHTFPQLQIEYIESES